MLADPPGLEIQIVERYRHMDESIRASHRTLSTPVTNPGLHEPAGQTIKAGTIILAQRTAGPAPSTAQCFRTAWKTIKRYVSSSCPPSAVMRAVAQRPLPKALNRTPFQSALILKGIAAFIPAVFAAF
jgi:hypothetical protein